MAKSMKKRTRGARLSSTSGLTPVGESWQIGNARAQFSEVFRRARTEGPQRITCDGQGSVVMIAEEQFAQLGGKPDQPKSIVQFFRHSPLVGVELDLERERDAERETEQ
ncbi:MAG: type II toxin-antitoxin system prevent-host-death family antitoxin [Terriglobales bacterium]